MKLFDALLVCGMMCYVAAAQDVPKKSNAPTSCLVIANVLEVREAGSLLYRDSYNVPTQNLKLAYSRDELENIMHSGVKVVVYDQSRETLGEARLSCLADMTQIGNGQK